MSVRNLEHLFHPQSIAVVGASDRPLSVGSLVMRNLQAAGFEGPIWPVNRRHGIVAGQQAWRTVSELPGVPELAVVCTPPQTVPDIIAELGQRGTRAAVVLAAGLKERARPGTPTYEQQMLDAAKPHLLRILGPNCVGLLVPGAHLNASFAHAAALPGSLAFVSQSGAMATAMLDWANSRGIGFSHFISLGDSADVDFGDVLDYLASDGRTRAILMYVESIRAARKFMSAARAAARNKPVILVKAGRAPEGAKAAASHTGALAGSDAVFDAAIRRAGMLRVNTLSDLFDAAETLARVRGLHGQRLAILTNGGGAGVLAADALSLGKGEMAVLGDETLEALNQSLPATWSHANPIDIIGDAPVERYLSALDALQRAQGVDAVLFMHAPTAVVPSAEIAKACIPAFRASHRPVLTCWMGGQAVA
jgi:acetyltransferase